MFSSSCVSLQVTSCMTVFNAVVGWIMVDAGSRKQYFASLLGGSNLLAFTTMQGPLLQQCCSALQATNQHRACTQPFAAAMLRSSGIVPAIRFLLLHARPVGQRACILPSACVSSLHCCSAHHAAHLQLFHGAVLLQQPNGNLARFVCVLLQKRVSDWTA